MYWLLVSQTYFTTQLDFTLHSAPGLDFYTNSTDWDLVNFTAVRHSYCCPYPMSDLTFYIHLKRKPLFYVFNMILPCILTLLVSFLAFLLPSGSGEKMSISITTLLSISVLLIVISDQLPPSSDYVPLISTYIYFLQVSIWEFLNCVY